MMTSLDRPKARPKALPPGKLPKDLDLLNLTDAMNGARRTLQRPRQERYRAVQEYAGGHYADGGTDHPVPVNLIGLYVQIMASALVSQSPKFMLTTHDSRQRAAVSACEDWLNAEVKRQYLCDTLQRCVIDSLFGVGILKVALADPGHAAANNWGLSAGQPFAQRVDFDDFVYDVYARTFEEASFLGHRYRVPKAAADKIYKDGRDLPTDTQNTDYNPEGDEKIGMVGRGDRYSEEFDEYVTLWEIYVPRHKVVLTLADDPAYGATDDEKAVLRVVKWVGPPCGPYHFLGFQWVPGSARPKGPIMDLIDIHRAVNRSYVKIIEDTDRCKAIGLVPSGATGDADRFMKASNGEWVQCDRPDAIKEVVTGGAIQAVLQVAMHLKEMFSWLAGNLDIVGGLSPQSKTASQDKMLNENSSRAVGDKQQAVVNFTSKVGDALLWYYWRHPQKVMDAPLHAPGLPGVGVMRKVYPAGARNEQGQPHKLRRDGYGPDILVDPYTLTHSTPQQRLAFLNQFIAATAPMLPLWAQQGVVMDANAYVSMVGKYGDVPEIQDIFTVQQPPAPPPGGDGGGDAPGMPANTTRTYERRSLGADSAGAKGNALSNAVAKKGAFTGKVGGE
jgi:hypothetical protein